MNGWNNEFEGNFWYRHPLNEVFMLRSYTQIKEIFGVDENLIAIVQDRRNKKKGAQHSAFFVHRAGINKTKKKYLELYKRGFIEVFEKRFKELQNLNERYKLLLLQERFPDLDQLKEILMLGGALHYSTQPHCMEGIEEEIAKITQNRFGNKSDLSLEILKSDLMNTLTKERISWLKLLTSFLEGKEIERGLVEHSQKYFSVDIVRRNVRDLNKLYVFPGVRALKEKLKMEAKKSVLADLNGEIEKLEREASSAKNGKGELFKRYEFSKDEQELIQVHAKLSHYRLEARLIWITYYVLLNYLARIKEKELGIKKYGLDHYSFEEFKEIITLKKLNVKEKEIRFVVYFKEEGEFKRYINDEAKLMVKSLDIPFEIPQTNHLKGNSAFPGRVEGRARVIFWNKEFEKQMDEMKEGEILIVDQTKPDLMMAIRKARGIVTNEGGLISHAAIISRELKIPCLIQTGYATKVFKTGDLVVLDAIKGVVYKK